MAIKASELAKLTQALDNVKMQVMDACAETIGNICEDTYKYARVRTPVDTGNLKESLAMETPAYNMGRGENEVYGEVHFGEPGHVGGWEDTEASEYMWEPGYNKRNWYGKILYDGWNKNKDRVVPELVDNIKSKL